MNDEEPASLYHIATRDDWDEGLREGSYSGPTLSSEGFIHLSTASQVAGTARRYYLGQKGLKLLHLDLAKLEAEVRFELTQGRGPYPHLYGRLNLDAVVSARDFDPEHPEAEETI